MYKIAAMGDRDSVSGFASLGLAVFCIDDPHDARHTLKRLADSDYAVIYITEQLLAQIPEEYERYKAMPLPALIPVPGARGNTGFGAKNVSRFVEQAVGSDIIN